ncbi:MAG: hypothetical protein JW888_12470, partial [Pirellulales bacterium]|nr:hypothetical protein [Pirellulales bacterium]
MKWKPSALVAIACIACTSAVRADMIETNVAYGKVSYGVGAWYSVDLLNNDIDYHGVYNNRPTGWIEIDLGAVYDLT